MIPATPAKGTSPRSVFHAQHHRLQLLQGALATLLGLALVSLIAVGIRLLVMQTVQQRRERANRQINERLKTLIAAYKTLGGSFTGNLTVDPSHLSERRSTEVGHGPAEPATIGSDRRRRPRDTVEAALSDVMLLGTPEQVRLAVQAANDMVAGRSVETAALVVSLRTFIREVLDLDAIPADVSIPSRVPFGPPQGARGQCAASVPAARMEGAKETKAVMAQVQALWASLKASRLVKRAGASDRP